MLARLSRLARGRAGHRRCDLLARHGSLAHRPSGRCGPAGAVLESPVLPETAMTSTALQAVPIPSRRGGRSRHGPGLGAAVALALACTGCAAPLVVQRVAPGEPPPPGLAYPLAYTRFEITVTRTLQACDAQGATVEVRVEAGAGHAAPDPAHHYVLRPGPGQAFWVTAAKAGYAPTGALKSFNASLDDRSAQAASAAAVVLRRFDWLGMLAGAARPPDCTALRTAAARQVERFQWPADGDSVSSLRPAPMPMAWPAAVHQPALHLRLVDEEGQALAPAAGAVAPAALPGLPYRLPRPARLQVCESDCSLAAPLLDLAVTVVQGGPLYLLPCEGHSLGRSQCMLEMNAAGATTAAGFGQARSPAEAGAGLAKDLLR